MTHAHFSLLLTVLTDATPSSEERATTIVSNRMEYLDHIEPEDKCG